MNILLGHKKDGRGGWLDVEARHIHGGLGNFLCCELSDLESSVEDSSAEEIQANGVLERAGWRDLDPIFVSLWKKLRSGGLLFVEVPDLEAIVSDYQSGKLSHAALQRHLFGTQGSPEDTYHSAWSELELTKRMQMVGLTVERVERNDHKLRAWARRTEKGHTPHETQ